MIILLQTLYSSARKESHIKDIFTLISSFRFRNQMIINLASYSLTQPKVKKKAATKAAKDRCYSPG